MANYKLTPHQVDAIRRERRTYNTPYRALSDKFHVCIAQIHRVCCNVNHVKPRRPFISRKQTV